MNKRLIKTLQTHKKKLLNSSYIYIYIDTYNNIVNEDLCGTITTRVSESNEIFIAERKKMSKIKTYNKCSEEHIKNNLVDAEGIANCITTNTQATANGVNLIKIRNATEKGYLEATDGDGIDCSTRMQTHRGTVQKGISQTLVTQDDIGVCTNQNGSLRIRKLTPKECFRLMGCKDDSTYDKLKNVAKLTDRELYHIAGDGLIANIPELLVKEIL